MEHETIAVVSDIHANRPALEVVLDDIEDRDIETIFCAGDIIGILGWNEWTVNTIRDIADQTVFGNHDARIRSDFAFTPSFPAARDEMALVAEQLNDEHIEWLSSLPDRIATDTYILSHSRPVYQRDPGYPFHGFAQGDYGVRPRDFTAYGSHIGDRVAMMGHTHEQHGLDCSKFPGQSGTMINPGSVGAPWDSDARYATVNLNTQEYDLHQIEYDNSRVRRRLDDVGLPVGKYD